LRYLDTDPEIDRRRPFREAMARLMVTKNEERLEVWFLECHDVRKLFGRRVFKCLCWKGGVQERVGVEGKSKLLLVCYTEDGVRRFGSDFSRLVIRENGPTMT